ncbi:MAG: hypothetical protein LBQ95_08705 [Lachnospiraceae bacterium]|jgi:hypothetical protein|nr:hypothetical protein [Lachnospiraceae bacterium]
MTGFAVLKSKVWWNYAGMRCLHTLWQVILAGALLTGVTQLSDFNAEWLDKVIFVVIMAVIAGFESLVKSFFAGMPEATGESIAGITFPEAADYNNESVQSVAGDIQESEVS